MKPDSRVERVGIVAATHRPDAIRWARSFIQLLADMDIDLRVVEELRDYCNDVVECGDQSFVADSDLIIVLGGDGTLPVSYTHLTLPTN